MDCTLTTLLAVAALLLIASDLVSAESRDLGNGFMDHGVATPVSNHRGIVATVDGEGRNVALVWLFDHTGGYAILVIDAQTGEAEQIPAPFKTGDCPYASILSSRNRYYTHFGNWFCEFDPAQRAFTFHHETTPQMAMSMTEDDNGVIWSATYPQSGLVSYDPATGEFSDYGHLYKQNWAQYPRYIATDDAGWVYFGVGSTLGQIIVFNPEDANHFPLVPEHERTQGSGVVYRDLNGKVYGQGTSGKENPWYELYRGEARRLSEPPAVKHKPYIAGSQGLFHQDFPNGERLAAVDLVNRRMVVTAPGGETRELKFDYTSEGAHLMSVAVAPNGTICGGTAFPMRFFSYNPTTDQWINREAYGQWNTIAPTADRFFVGGYGHGYLLEWDPAREWVPTVKDDPNCNPRFLAQAHPDINRPHDLLPWPDDSIVVLAGTPGYGYTGGGLLIWDRTAESATILTHTDLIPQHSAMSLLDLPDRRLLVGSTIAAGTGGEVKASLAEMYILNLDTNQIEWRAPVIEGAQSYMDLCHGPGGIVFGIVDSNILFAFDPAKRELLHQQNIEAEFGRTSGGQGPRIFVHDPKGNIYLLLSRGIAELDPESFELTLLAQSPVPIAVGGDWLDGRIYFGSASHVYSWQVQVPQ